MRYTYGVMDERRILLYQPYLFRKADELLVFPSKDFHKWHSDVLEFIDGLYQINCLRMDKGKFMNIMELNLASGVISNINDELEHLFDSKRVYDFSYQYVSTLDEKYRERRVVGYTKDFMKANSRITVKPEITPWLKEKNLMEIVNQVAREFTMSQRKKQKKLIDL